MTNIADYEEWDYRRCLKIDHCHCDDPNCESYVLSARGLFTTQKDVDDYKWMPIAVFDNELLVDLIKNCISAMEVNENNLDERQKLEMLLGLTPTADDEE